MADKEHIKLAERLAKLTAKYDDGQYDSVDDYNKEQAEVLREHSETAAKNAADEAAAGPRLDVFQQRNKGILDKLAAKALGEDAVKNSTPSYMAAWHAVVGNLNQLAHTDGNRFNEVFNGAPETYEHFVKDIFAALDKDVESEEPKGAKKQAKESLTNAQESAKEIDKSGISEAAGLVSGGDTALKDTEMDTKSAKAWEDLLDNNQDVTQEQLAEKIAAVAESATEFEKKDGATRYSFPEIANAR